VDRDISPEERLLRLIRLRTKKEDKLSAEMGKKENASPGTPQAQVSSGSEKSGKSAEGILAQYSALLPQFKNIIIINKILFGIFVALMLYFLVDYFFLPSVEVDGVATIEPVMEESIEGEPVRHPYSYYEKEIAGKDLFKALIKEEPEFTEAPEKEIEDITASLSLLGVVSGANPQAIIQDSAKKKTYFLNAGSKLGEVTLKEILEDEGRVIFIYKGREFDLAM